MKKLYINNEKQGKHKCNKTYFLDRISYARKLEKGLILTEIKGRNEVYRGGYFGHKFVLELLKME